MGRAGRAPGRIALAITTVEASGGVSTSPSKAWSALLHGRWVVAHVADRDGRRYLVARPAKVDRHGAEGLTRRELVAIRFVAAGLPYKLVAAELGVSSATAGRLALAALKKLGLASRIELATLLGR